MTKQYTVVYERGDSNWSAYVPELPGCIATGKNREPLETQICDTIEFHIEGLRLDGQPVPEPSVEAATVTVTA